MSPPSERRRDRRFHLHMPVEVLDTTEHPQSTDLSEGGMFIETPVPRQVGMMVPLRLIHPRTGEPIRAVCQVVRQVRDADGSPCGLGLRFANVDESLGERIRALIHELVTPVGEPIGLEVDPDDTGALAVVELDTHEVTWDELVVEGVIIDAAEDHPAPAPIVWPDTRPQRIPGADCNGLTPAQESLLSMVDGKRTVDELAHAAGCDLETALGELSDLARRTVVPSNKVTEPDDDSGRAKPLFPGREEQAVAREHWQKARALVIQGLAAERSDDFETAVRLLEQALELNSPNAADIHARLAVVGLEHIGDLDLAERHACEALALQPNRPHARRLVRRIKRLRGRGVSIAPQQKPKAPAPRPHSPRNKAATPPVSSKRLVLVALLAVGVAGLVGWNVYRYLGARVLEAPQRLDVHELVSLVPALDARVRSGRLVVTTSSAWNSLTTMEKTDRLRRLATWARRTHGITSIVVADERPILRARVRDGRVELLEPR